MATDYTTWEHSALVARVHSLEQQLRAQTAEYQRSSPTSHPPAAEPRKTSQVTAKTYKQFDPTRHSTRHIALKFAYLGHKYNGFEHANGNRTPLPTIEEMLWKGLRKARLIWPPSEECFEVEYNPAIRMKRPVEISWEGCEYSKCGRTDKGVNAFGQVIGIRVRSNRPGLSPPEDQGNTPTIDSGDDTSQNGTLISSTAQATDTTSKIEYEDPKDELPYIAMLNGILPPDIRILAWCPNPPSKFDARFACQERRYKYFFTNPAFAPLPGNIGLTDGQGRQAKVREGWLDVEAMRAGAQRLVGLHDFRNLCKVDPSKQLTNFLRRITYADIEAVDQATGPVSFSSWPLKPKGHSTLLPDNAQCSTQGSHNGPQVYAFTVHGSAFLWHQVRCMVAILFLIGQGLEKPSLISELLDVERNPSRPTYDMADESPLVLWDCLFPHPGSAVIEDNMDWVYAGDARSLGRLSKRNDPKFGLAGNVEEIWKLWRKRKMDEILSSTLLDLAISQGDGTSWARGGFIDPGKVDVRSQKVFEGRDGARLNGKYIPVMQKDRTDPVEMQNARWREGRGVRRQLKQSKATPNTEQ